MSYRTILAVIAPETEEGAMPIAPIVLDLAARWKAHLTALFAVSNVTIPVGGIEPGGMIMALEENVEGVKQAKKLASAIEVSARANGVTASTEVHSAPFDNLLSELAATGRLHDLIVARKTEATSPLLIETLLFETTRPCLFVPDGIAGPLDLRKVMIAWDGGRESARAVHLALPILAKAKEIAIVTVSGEKTIGRNAAGADCARMLARHDIMVETRDLPHKGKAGDVLLDHAMANRFDLLVSGAYAHSRLRHFIFGGVTTALLADARLPLLMAH
jgi:nucleotide-binding universal stress UspA family protein